MAEPITTWAIVEGGLIQDASSDVRWIDLDWVPGDYERANAEECWLVLHHVVTTGHDGWAPYLEEVHAMLLDDYRANAVDYPDRVWART